MLVAEVRAGIDSSGSVVFPRHAGPRPNSLDSVQYVEGPVAYGLPGIGSPVPMFRLHVTSSPNSQW